ncbi:MAG: insulinase family protein [Gemmatimonadaceae bacterium]|nr:insulinase family protein [Gemmatimonadaceae bacterium]MCW5826869.1 insulinase family protein [Gemmatimonadaceae bacterium]
MLRVALLVVAVCVGAAAAVAQEGPVDRRVPPQPGPTPAIQRLPFVSSELPNGIRLVVARRTGVPLVSFTLELGGGASSFDPPALPGAVSLLANLMEQGSRSHPGQQFAEASQRLGVRIALNFGREDGTIGFTAMPNHLESAMHLVAGLAAEPAFDTAAFELVRRRAIQTVTGWQSQLNALATGTFLNAVFGEQHPYAKGLRTTEPLTRITLDDLRAVHREYLQPGRATILVVGDVDPATVRAQVEAAFGGWSGDGAPTRFDYPPLPRRTGASIHLVDLPGATQTQFLIGLPAMPRASPDFYAAVMLRQILGTGLQSRLSQNLRERRGFTYDIWAGFEFGRGPGAFRVVTAVERSKTDSALVEILRELRGIAGEIPIAEAEFEQARQAIASSLVGRFQTVQSTAFALRGIVQQGAGEDFYIDLARRYQEVTREDIVRVARTYLDVDRMVVAVAGDRATIEAMLAKLQLGPIVIHDVEGRPVR